MSGARGTGPVLSIVIPTKDRLESLKRTLDAIGRQTPDAESFELLVADDGSSDGTAAFLAAPPAYPFRLRSVRLAGSGPAAARNRAIRLAEAPRVLLLGDDTYPAPDAAARHLEAAAGREVGVQGRIEWDPAAPITPVMRFLAPEGPQFYFKGMVNGLPIPYTAMYASNFSAPTRWFLEDPFDEGFPAAAFEDTELAYRWIRKGRVAIYWESALCVHRHHYDRIESFLARQRAAGRAARHAARLHPAMAVEAILKPIAVGLLFGTRYLLRRLGGSASETELWDLKCRRAFLDGVLSW